MIELPGTAYCYNSLIREEIEQTSERVKSMRSVGKLSVESLRSLRKFFKIRSIYNSNAIEGNALDMGETRIVIEQGMTITGKPLKDQAEAKNLSEAIDFLELLTANEEPITESDIRQIHALVLKGIDEENAGSYRSVSVQITGSEFKQPEAIDVPGQMAEFSKWLAERSCGSDLYSSADGFITAIVAHAWLVYIHPFIDGNGRVARLLMNLILTRCGFPLAIVTKEDRLRYYDALEESQSSDLSSFISLVNECLLESLEEYERFTEEQKRNEEWAKSIASKFGKDEKIQAQNEYEVWKSSMDLFKNYFRQSVDLIDKEATFGKIFFKDFGMLEEEKYLGLRVGESAKKTWFFRIDFVTEKKSARYLFFFGYPNHILHQKCDVTIHIAREGNVQYQYEWLDKITGDDAPNIVEIGYKADSEDFVVRHKNDIVEYQKIEKICKDFVGQVIRKQFS